MVNRMAGTVNHHSFRAGEFSAGEMGNFQVALTERKGSELRLTSAMHFPRSSVAIRLGSAEHSTG